MFKSPIIKVINGQGVFELSSGINILSLHSGGVDLSLIDPNTSRYFAVDDLALSREKNHLWVEFNQFPGYSLLIKEFFQLEDEQNSLLTVEDENNNLLELSSHEGGIFESYLANHLPPSTLAGTPVLTLLMGQEDDNKKVEKTDDTEALLIFGGVVSLLGGIWALRKDKDDVKVPSKAISEDLADLPSGDNKPDDHSLAGTITLGPVFPDHNLTLMVTSITGTILAISQIDEYGHYEVDLTNPPDQLKVMVVDNGDGGDYIDESTGELKDLDVDLMAWTSLNTDNAAQTIHINPLTTLAAQLAEKVSAENSTELTTEQLNQINHKIGELFLDDGVDITAYKIDPAINVLGEVTEANIGGEALALVSAMESHQALSTQQVIDQLVQGIVLDEDEISLDAETTALIKESQQSLPESMAAVGSATISIITEASQLHNLAPSASSSQFSISEDTLFEFSESTFAFYDENPEDKLHSVTITTLPEVGSLWIGNEQLTETKTLSLSDVSQLVFKPEEDAHGIDYAAIHFTLSDGILDSEVNTITLHVLSINDAPNVEDSLLTINEDAPYSLQLDDLSFTDKDNDSLSAITLVELPEFGHLTLNDIEVTESQTIAADQLSNLVYTPEENRSGENIARLRYVASDGTDVSASSAEIQINITPINDKPKALDSTVRMSEDTSYSFSVADIGYEDDDNDPLDRLKIISLPVNGVLSFSGINVIEGLTIDIGGIAGLVFTPEADAFSMDYATIGFQVSDGTEFSEQEGFISIEVTAVNDPPQAINGAITIDEDNSYTFSVADFGFSDTEGDALQSVIIDTLPESGELTLHDQPVTENQEITAAEVSNLTYTPGAEGFGENYANFDYRVKDNNGESENTAEMNLNVNSVNDLPEVSNTEVEQLEDNEVTLGPDDFPFIDNDGDSLEAIIIDVLPNEGTLELSGVEVIAGQEITADQLANLVYIPPENASGDSYAIIEYRVSDGSSYSETAAQLSINIVAVNDPPVATDSTVTLDEDATYAFNVNDINFSDAEGESLQAIIIDELPEQGVLTLDDVPVRVGDQISVDQFSILLYTPDEHGAGDNYAVVTYRVFDGEVYSESSATLTFTVTPINDAPIAIEKRIGGTFEETQMTLLIDEVLELVADPEGDPITLSSISIDSQHGTIDELQAEWLKLTPAQDVTGDSIPVNVTVSDGQLETDYQFFIKVINLNDAPVTANSALELTKNVPHVFSETDFAFTDVDQDSLAAIEIVALPDAGVLELSSSAVTVGQTIQAADFTNLIFTPGLDAVQDNYASIQYRVSDGELLSDSIGELQLNVNEPLAAPAYSLELANESFDISLLEPALIDDQVFYVLDANNDRQLSDADKLNQAELEALMTTDASLTFTEGELHLINVNTLGQLGYVQSGTDHAFWALNEHSALQLYHDSSVSLGEGYAVYHFIS